jgi:hypothetical protein
MAMEKALRLLARIQTLPFALPDTFDHIFSQIVVVAQ